MKSLGDLAKTMSVLADRVRTNSDQAVRDVAESVAPVVVYTTPVDTGRARANWQSSVGTPATGVLFVEPEAPESPAAGALMALKSIRDATALYKGQTEGVFITNNLYYIEYLNNGSSSQAPANFVEKAVIVGINSVKTVRLLK